MIDSVSAVGTLATLAATATDVEDDASGTALNIAWVSSIEGNLGTGANLIVTLFDNAEHNITATATDSDGKSASDSASLTIGTSPPSPFDRTAKHRPIPIGISTGHPDITAGMIGARVTDGAGNVYALSNNPCTQT